jgi:hypothetical protein
VPVVVLKREKRPPTRRPLPHAVYAKHGDGSPRRTGRRTAFSKVLTEGLGPRRWKTACRSAPKRPSFGQVRPRQDRYRHRNRRRNKISSSSHCDKGWLICCDPFMGLSPFFHLRSIAAWGHAPRLWGQAGPSPAKVLLHCEISDSPLSRQKRRLNHHRHISKPGPR